MKVYIEKEAALELSKHLDRENGNKHFVWGVETYAEYLQGLPPADVKPVVKGHWIWEENEWQYRCSVCRITFDYDKTYELFDHGYQYASFCPNCGAEMNGANDGEI